MLSPLEVTLVFNVSPYDFESLRHRAYISLNLNPLYLCTSIDYLCNMTSPAWYVFYCASRAEKKAAEALRQKGYEVFLPLQTTVRQWSDRKKKVSEPLFKGYLFVRCTTHQFSAICSVQGIVAPVKIGAEWGRLRDEDQQAIQRFIEEGIFAETVSEKLVTGDRVTVTQGIFKGLKGHVTHHAGESFFYLSLDTLQLSVKVKLPGEYLHKL